MSCNNSKLEPKPASYFFLRCIKDRFCQCHIALLYIEIQQSVVERFLCNILLEINHALDHAQVVINFAQTKFGLLHFAFALESIKREALILMPTKLVE